MIQCAQIGLEPNTALGHAYIIPFGNYATLIIGYKGLIQLCRRSKEFSNIYAQEVYDGDYFEMEIGTSPSIKHKPCFEKDHSEKYILGCYAIAKNKDGSYIFDYMTKKDIDKIRGRSKTSNSGPWVTDYVMMARKTVIKRLMHYLPLTIELAEAIKLDSENDVTFGDVSILDGEQEKEDGKEEKEAKK
jgi:recombination protein RecT